MLGATIGVAAALGLAAVGSGWQPTNNYLTGRGMGNLQRDATDVVFTVKTVRDEGTVVACLKAGATAPLNLQDYGRQRTRDYLLINVPRAAVIFIADDGTRRTLTLKSRGDRPLGQGAIEFVRRCAAGGQA